jgi:uncharacterized protein
MSDKPRNRMLEALAKVPRLRLVDDVEALMDEHGTTRLDSWFNNVTGLGTDRDKSTFNAYGGSRVLYEDELSALYHGDDLAARMVDLPPDEMLREGFSVDTGEPELTARIADKIDALGLDGKLANGIRWGRLFGGGGLLLGCDDGRSAAAPLQAEKANALSYVYEVDRRYLWPLTWYRDTGNTKLGQPETYMVTSPTSYTDIPVSVVHETRLVLFDGATTGLREREMNSGWDHSVLQRANDVLGNFNMGWNAVSVLLADGNQSVFKMSGLAEAISAGQQEALTARLRAMDESRSVVRAIVIDAGDSESGGTKSGESFERQPLTLAGYSDVLQQLVLRLAAAVRMPATILMGQSPAGMNATGESDFRWFYDQIRSDQTRKLAPKIRRLVQIMLATREFATKPKQLLIKFPPLWTESPQAAAQTRKVKAETDSIRILSGELLPEEVAVQRASPDGYENDIVLTDEGRTVRDAVLVDEFAKLTPNPGVDKDVPTVELAPTDAASVMTVDEARAKIGLGAWPGPDGALTVAQFRAKAESQGTAQGTKDVIGNPALAPAVPVPAPTQGGQ